MISKECKEYVLRQLEFVEKSLMNVEDATKRVSLEDASREEYKGIMRMTSEYIKSVSLHLGHLGEFITLEPDAD